MTANSDLVKRRGLRLGTEDGAATRDIERGGDIRVLGDEVEQVHDVLLVVLDDESIIAPSFEEASLDVAAESVVVARWRYGLGLCRRWSMRRH